MTDTTTRPRLATATSDVLREAVETEEMRNWLRWSLIRTVWGAAINAGGIGMYDLTELRVIDMSMKTAMIQQQWDEEAAAEGREAATAPDFVTVVVDATILWPPDEPPRYREDA